MPIVKMILTEIIYHKKIINLTENEFENLQLAEKTGCLDEAIAEYMSKDTEEDNAYEDGEYEVL